MIPDEKVVITISHAGYIKRTSLDEYKIQNRGGVGQRHQRLEMKIFLKIFLSEPITNTCYFYPKRQMLLDESL